MRWETLVKQLLDIAEAHGAVERYPAVAESLERLAAATGAEHRGDTIAALESDAGLLMAALRLANRGARARTVGAAAAAVDALGFGTLGALGASTPVFSFFDDEANWYSMALRLRQHAQSVSQMAEQLVSITGGADHEEIVTAALLNNIGKLVMSLRFGYARMFGGRIGSPIDSEREKFGTDHSAEGAALARAWNWPERLVAAIEHNHDPAAEGDAAFVFVADQIIKYGQGQPVAIKTVAEVATRIGVSRDQIGELLYKLPYPVATRRPAPGASPLSERELSVLRLLAEGLVYKQIAVELGLSASTVRSHTHRIYKRIGAADRAQAVLTAVDAGWI
jgi:DNA-binding NarL/FixJ family response regulator